MDQDTNLLVLLVTVSFAVGEELRMRRVKLATMDHVS